MVKTKKKQNIKLAPEKKSAPAAKSAPAVKTEAQIYFDKIAEVQPNSSKGSAVHGMLFPLFRKIFDTKENDKEIQGVKLQEDMAGGMLTYVFNRAVTEKDIEAVKAAFGAAGFRLLDASGNQMTVAKAGYTWVISFWLNNPQKGGVSITI